MDILSSQKCCKLVKLLNATLKTCKIVFYTSQWYLMFVEENMVYLFGNGLHCK